MSKEISALAMTGMLGSGFHESSFKRALSWNPDFIGCDAGSTDSGPASLGMGIGSQPPSGIKRDLRIGLLASREKKIPLIIGSAASGGGRVNLDLLVSIATKIAKEEGLHFRLGIIDSEQDKAYLNEKLSEGRIHPLKPEMPINTDIIDHSEHIVGMMGIEPFLQVLDAGAEVVIAGRSSDTSIYAAIPISQGFAPGPTWHAAKILECGAACAEYRPHGTDSMFARIGDEYFIVEPPHPEYKCTPLSVAAHTFYETSSPILLPEPSGVLDTTYSNYEAIDQRIVRVTGSQFHPSDVYTVKLEGVESLGYRSVCIVGVRDPILIANYEEWLTVFKDKIRTRVENMYGSQFAEKNYHFSVRAYGRDGVLGKNEPIKDSVSHELCLILEVIAPTQNGANEIILAAAQGGLHLAVPGLQGSTVSNFAFPYSPRYMPQGKAYRFNLNHVIEVEDPCEMFKMEIVNL